MPTSLCLVTRKSGPLLEKSLVMTAARRP
ncbi:hypothetical protein ACHAW6_007016 [Cyclotella cf. meneghiniana]